MATPSAKGSPLYEIIILVLIVVLFLAIYVPSSQWGDQRARTRLARQSMEDVYRASHRYAAVTQMQTPSLETIIEFMRQDTMEITAAKYERERLNLIPGVADSLLVGFPDSFHVERITWDNVTEDSVVLTLKPYDRYSFMPASQWAFASDTPVEVFERASKKSDTYVIVHTQDSLRLTELPADTIRVPSKDYLLSQPLDSIGLCPAVRRPFDLNVNVKITLNGLVNTIINKDVLPDSIPTDTLLQKLVINKFRGDAIARTQEVINQDTAISNMKDSLRFVEIKDSLFFVFFNEKIDQLLPKDQIRLENDHTVNTSSDSINMWYDKARMKNTIFGIAQDPLVDRLMRRENVLELFPRVSFEESYEVTKIDTVGITIGCPMTEEDQKKPRGLFKSIFGVRMEDNHGEIKNGDLSWSEKK
jgi:hypothetical protein